MKTFFAFIDSQHGSYIWVETSETERQQNGEMERTAAKDFVVRFWNFAKNKNVRLIGEQTAAAHSEHEWCHS